MCVLMPCWRALWCACHGHRWSTHRVHSPFCHHPNLCATVPSYPLGDGSQAVVRRTPPPPGAPSPCTKITAFWTIRHPSSPSPDLDNIDGVEKRGKAGGNEGKRGKAGGTENSYRYRWYAGAQLHIQSTTWNSVRQTLPKVSHGLLWRDHTIEAARDICLMRAFLHALLFV